MRTHPAPGSIVQFSYTVSVGSQADAVLLFKAWQALLLDPGLDRRFGTEFIMEPLGCVITGTFYGTRDEFDATGIPSRLPATGGLDFTVNGWLASLVQAAENEALYLTGIPAPFYAKSFGFRPQDALPEDKIRELFEWVDGADKGTALWFIIFDAEGGAVNDVAINATAYPHRDKFMFYQSYVVDLPLGGDAARAFLTGFHARVQPAISSPDVAHTYAGYVDPALADGPREYWGPNLPTLELVKRKWDAGNLFRNPQSVPPASG